MEEMLVVMGVVAVVAWWMHSGSEPAKPQPTHAAVVEPAAPAPATPALETPAPATSKQ